MFDRPGVERRRASTDVATDRRLAALPLVVVSAEKTLEYPADLQGHPKGEVGVAYTVIHQHAGTCGNLWAIQAQNPDDEDQTEQPDVHEIMYVKFPSSSGLATGPLVRMEVGLS